MVYQSILTLSALLSPILIGLVATLEQTQKVAFPKDAVGKRFGDLCPRAGETSQWKITDMTNFTNKVDNAVWVCPRAGCKISEKNGFNTLFTVPDGAAEPSRILLQLEPNAKPIHANTYVCETDPYSSGGDTFNYEVTIYDEKLSCSDNVTQHKAGETIEMKCGITAWGKGKADLEFQVLDSNDKVESTIQHSVTANTEISMLFPLTKKHHEKKLRCNFKGFDSQAAETTNECILNDGKLNILYTPEITTGLPPYKFITTSDDSAALNCQSDANPKADPTYYLADKSGASSEVDGDPTRLEATSTSLKCLAENALGKAESVMKINHLSFQPQFPQTMKAGQTAQILCVLTQSNQITEAPVEVKTFVGEELIGDGENVQVDKIWNGKKIICVASSKPGEVLRTETQPLNVMYDPEIFCEEQSSTSEYSLRKCILDQNPLSAQEEIKLSPESVEREWGSRDPFRQNFTIKIKRSVLADKENQKQDVLITVSNIQKTYTLNYTNTSQATTLIVGLAAGILILIIVVALLIIFLRRGGFCAKKSDWTDSEKCDSQSNFPSDDGHGQPPATRSMNGYDNKIAPNDDGLVYADLAFSDHQPRSRAPIIDPYSTTDYADIDFAPQPPPYTISDSVG